MLVAVEVKAPEDASKRDREAATQLVLDHFPRDLSDARLLCFLDDEEWQGLKREVGIANRGVFLPIGQGPRPWWSEAPHYIKEVLNAGNGLAFDSFIYMH